MIIKLRMLVVGPSPKDSNIFIGDNLYTPSYPQRNLSGLYEATDDMFEHLSKRNVCEILAYSCITAITPSSIMYIAHIDPFRFLHECIWKNAETLPSSLREKVRKVIGLITWLESEHFKYNTRTLRSCIICNEKQHGKGTGQFFGGFHSPSTPSLGNEEKYNFSPHCLNPYCLSHEVEKIIDPDYEISKEAFK